MPLERGSETLEDLLNAARDRGMSKQIGLYAAQCLAEYFKARREGRILPEGMTLYTVAVPSGMMPPMFGPGAATQPAIATSTSNNHQDNGSNNGTSSADLERLANRPEVIDLNPEDSDGDDLSYFFNQEDEDDEE